MGRPFVGLWRHPDFLKQWAGQTVCARGVRVSPLEQEVVTWYYGFGLFNWRPYKFSVAYYNWGRSPIMSPGFVANGAIVASFSWTF